MVMVFWAPKPFCWFFILYRIWHHLCLFVSWTVWNLGLKSVTVSEFTPGLTYLLSLFCWRVICVAGAFPQQLYYIVFCLWSQYLILEIILLLLFFIYTWPKIAWIKNPNYKELKWAFLSQILGESCLYFLICGTEFTDIYSSRRKIYMKIWL